MKGMMTDRQMMKRYPQMVADMGYTRENLKHLVEHELLQGKYVPCMDRLYIAKDAIDDLVSIWRYEKGELDEEEEDV